MKTKILIIDDDKIQLNLIKDFLESENFTIDLADGYYKALEYMQKKLYGIIITDKFMPIDNEKVQDAGTKIIEFAKKNQPYAEIVMITGNQDVEAAVTAMKQGIFDYLVKPLRMEDVTNVVDKIISHNGFINPDSVMEIYKNFNKEVLILFETLVGCNKESKNNLIRWIDDKIYSFLKNQKKWENIILEQRDSLSNIGRFSQELIEKIGKNDENYELVEKICLFADKRI